MVGISKADYRLCVPEYRRFISIAKGNEDRGALPYWDLFASCCPDAFSKQGPARVQRFLVSRQLPKCLGADDVPLALDDERSVGGIDGKYIDIKEAAPS